MRKLLLAATLVLSALVYAPSADADPVSAVGDGPGLCRPRFGVIHWSFTHHSLEGLSPRAAVASGQVGTDMAAYRVRLVVAVPNRWPTRKPVPTARWVHAVDRRDGVTLWDCGELRVCSPPRGDLIGARHPNQFAGNHPVGQVAGLRDLHRAEEREIDMPAANHAN
jgi:hypothetical protein